MKEPTESVIDVVKSRLTNPLYGTFVLAWIIFHWNFIFSIFVLDDNKIFDVTGLLKNEYLLSRYFNFNDWYFYFSWVMPFIATYLIIWKLPEWVLIPAYRKDKEYETEKRKIKNTEEMKVTILVRNLEEEIVKTTDVVKERIVAEKKIEEVDPTTIWEREFQDFRKNSDISVNFGLLIKAVYENNGNIDNWNQYGDKLSRLVPNKILSYAHSNDLVEFIDTTNEKIKLTPKGKYFTKRFQEENIF